jgi:hypothetical protein
LGVFVGLETQQSCRYTTLKLNHWRGASIDHTKLSLHISNHEYNENIFMQRIHAIAKTGSRKRSGGASIFRPHGIALTPPTVSTMYVRPRAGDALPLSLLLGSSGFHRDPLDVLAFSS